ncbi:hypothetical protein M404DRAFT_1000082 [Pisolithus tinctorius Marx 270]|uniref:Uncharacterized protein n=1 Tax=Pisolithus tinctorius Marx 270 TaxID=870435 RepID=A0A0C3NVV8_PISTI|nr:hypothetical protein M404DRAFT_1000082 [Pisolithus tinctorius Marx 270]
MLALLEDGPGFAHRSGGYCERNQGGQQTIFQWHIMEVDDITSQLPPSMCMVFF